MAHLRNAMSREPQTDMSDAMHGKAHSHLQAHMNSGGKTFDEHFDFVMAEIARFNQRATDIAALRAEDGKSLSAAKFVQLKGLRDGLDELLRLETPSNDAPVNDSVRLRLAIARRRLQARGILEHAS